MLIKNQSLIDHLLELRRRLIYSLVFFFTAFASCYFFVEEIYDFLLKPLSEIFEPNQNKRIIYTGLAEAFVTYVKLAFLSSLFVSFPFFTIQFYLFLAPALYKKEKKIILSLLIFSPLLFLIGSILVYYLVFPLAFKFFVNFELSSNLSSMPIELEAKISEYLSLVLKLIFAFGVAFQLPILIILLVKVGFLSVESLKSKRKYFILLIFIFAAILTPPDIFSQIFLAIPMILLYEISILISSKINKKNQENDNN